MKNKHIVEPILFEQIKEDLRNAYTKDCKKRDLTPREHYIWGNAPEEPSYPNNECPENPRSLREMMLCHESIQAFLKKDPDKHLIGKKRLYDFQNLNPHPKTQKIHCPHFELNLCALYLGYEDVDAFLATLENAPSDKTSIIYWVAYYYSYKSHRVKKFKFQIDYSKTPYEVIEKGWHDEIEEKGVNIYRGFCTRKDDYLFFNLTNGSNGRAFTLTVILGTEKHIKDCMFMTGSFTAISTHDWVSTSEAVFVKTDMKYEVKLSKQSKLIVKRYLMLKQNSFRVNNKYYENLQRFKDVRRQQSDYFENFVGVHRVWGFDTEGSIYQSFFHIRADYRAYYYTDIYKDENLKKQVCLLKFSETHIQRLCISTHPFIGTGIVSLCMINILDTKDVITEGGFVTVGIQEKSKPITSYIVLKKEDNTFKEYFDRENEENIKPEYLEQLKLGKLQKEDLKTMIAKDNSVQLLFDKLTAYMKKSNIKTNIL